MLYPYPFTFVSISELRVLLLRAGNANQIHREFNQVSISELRVLLLRVHPRFHKKDERILFQSQN